MGNKPTVVLELDDKSLQLDKSNGEWSWQTSKPDGTVLKTKVNVTVTNGFNGYRKDDPHCRVIAHMLSNKTYVECSYDDESYGSCYRFKSKNGVSVTASDGSITRYEIQSHNLHNAFTYMIYLIKVL